MKRIGTTSLISFLLLISTSQCLQRKEPAITKELIEFAGRYVGILPCADCDGIKYDLTLSADGTYSEEVKYLGRSDEIFHQSGNWHLESDSTLLVESDDDPRSFASAGEKLILLDKNGKKMNVSSSEMYSLKRVGDDFDKVLNQAMNMGRMGMMNMVMEDMETDFSAHGNEPYWTLKVDFENVITFKTMDEMEIRAAVLQVGQVQDSKLIRFKGEEGTTSLIVTVGEESCSDGMSDEIFRNKVRVDLKNEGDENYTTYEGCGNYLIDYRLHDIWVLTHINNKPIESVDESPTFEFYSKEEKMMGNMGCNEFNGTFYRSGKNELRIGELALTRKMCPDMSTEQVLSRLSGKRVKYAIEDLNLTLTEYDGTSLTFKKVD